jgi:hypothetical protein
MANEFRIGASSVFHRFVRPSLDYFSILQNDDFVAVTDGTQAMGDD